MSVENPKNVHSFRKTKSYVQITLDGRSRQTGMVKLNLSEEDTVHWNQILSFNIDAASVKDIPSMVVVVDVLDKAMFGSDNNLGTVNFSLGPYKLGDEVAEETFDLDTGGKVTIKIKLEKRAS